MTSPQDRSESLPRPSPRAPDLRGRRALVVGGSGGIGRAVSMELVRAGASVVIHGGSSRDRLDAAVSEARSLASEGQRVEGSLLPVSRPGDLIGRLPELGSIDLVACSFGPFVRASLAATTTEEWERVCLLDLALPGALASSLLPAMSARGWGRMLFFGGTRTDGIRAYTSNAAYAAAKTGVSVLVKSLAVEGGPSGVAAVAVCPGLVDTEYLDEGTRRELRAKAPRAGLLATGALARAAVALIAADPCLASGAIVTLDAGLAF